jgi:L,D-transpeptidase ErfK/SrfK
LPGEATPVYLPTMLVVPDAPRDGLIINLPSMRLLYFVAAADDADGQVHAVTSNPIGIGREGWATPIGKARITTKTANPSWYPPASVRAEHEALGDPLPSVVPPGPDNPLGAFKMRLSLPNYLIHGTNKPAGVGMRVSHGCIRLYPEDIATLFERVPTKTPVYLVNEPVLAGWRDGELFLEVHPPLAEDERDLVASAEQVVAAALRRADRDDAALDAAAIARVLDERRGIPFPILAREQTLDQYLTESRIVENTLPRAVAENTASR